MGKNKKKNQDANKEAVAIEPMAKVGVGEPKSISILRNKNQKKKKMIEGVEQFDPNLNLANLFSGPVGSISKVVCNDKLTPVVAPIKLKNEKKERLNNKDAAEIRVRARAQMKFESQSSVDDGIVTNGLRKKVIPIVVGQLIRFCLCLLILVLLLLFLIRLIRNQRK